MVLSATDITALLSAMENLAVTTGAAVAMSRHFAKGNAAAKIQRPPQRKTQTKPPPT